MGEVPPLAPVSFSAVTVSVVASLTAREQGLWRLRTREKGSQLDGQSQGGGEALPQDRAHSLRTQLRRDLWKGGCRLSSVL